MKILNLGNSNDFPKVLGNTENVLVDFWASWCGPCKTQAPILQEVAATVEDGIIIKVDVDQLGDLANKYTIENIPTLIVFKGGNEIARFIGVQSKDTLIEALAK